MNLDPRSIPYRVAERIVRLALPLVIVVSGSGFGVGSAVAVLLIAGSVLAICGWEVALYRRFSYAVTADTLDIRSGVFSRRERQVPIGRIQNVDTSQNLLQRALGITDVRLETAGGSGTEARLQYLSTDAVRGLRAALRRREGDENAAEPESTRLFAISSRELLLLGLTSIDLRVLSLATILLPVFGVPIAMLGPGETIPVGPAGTLALAPLSAAAVLVVSGVARGVIGASNYYGFELARVGSDLRYERGLLQRSEGTIPTDKIQALALDEPLVARLLGYATLAVETAGYAPGDGPSGGSAAAIPLATRQRCLSLARRIEPVSIPAFERPPKRARTRYLLRYAIVVCGLTAAGWALARVFAFPIPWYGLAFPAVLLFTVVPVGAHLKWANRGYALAEGFVLTRNGFWTRTTAIVPNYRVQTVSESATMFQRRRSLATLTVDTAGASGSRVARAVDVDGEVAARLRTAVAERLQDALATRRATRAARPSMDRFAFDADPARPIHPSAADVGTSRSSNRAPADEGTENRDAHHTDGEPDSDLSAAE